MTTAKTNPRPYIAPAWQAAHLAALPVGGKALLIVPCEPQPPEDADEVFAWFALNIVAEMKAPEGAWYRRRATPHFLCESPFGHIGSILSIKAAGDFRVTSVDLRRSDLMTDLEALRWGTFAWAENPKRLWVQDYPKHPWGAWAWFVTVEKAER